MTAPLPALIAAGAWIAFLAYPLWRLRDSRSLDEYTATPPAPAPLVSVIVPARNEARNIARCLRAILGTTYPSIEVILVDDHSTDGTGEIARRIAAEDAAARVTVLDAPELPEGWFGKQWACHTGVQRAKGEILCFTDADTAHGPELLARSVSAMRERDADLFTVAGKQEMGSFWEKVVQPVVFAILISHYGGMEEMSRATRPTRKIANGQFLLFPRASYERAGGHAAVRDHVAEDLRLAQRLTAMGMRVHMVFGRDHLSTRMYTSLNEIRRGWGKNLFAAGRDTLALNAITRRLLPFVFPVPALLPLLPAVVLLLALAGVLGAGAWWFGVIAGGANLLFWFGIYSFSRLNPLWGLLHPLGALVFAGICAESAWKGSRVEWKGRRYLSSSAEVDKDVAAVSAQGKGGRDAR